MDKNTMIALAREVWSAGEVYIGPPEDQLARFAALVIEQHIKDTWGKPQGTVKEPQPGVVNLDAFPGFVFVEGHPLGGFIGETAMLKWLVLNREGDYWKGKSNGS